MTRVAIPFAHQVRFPIDRVGPGRRDSLKRTEASDEERDLRASSRLSPLARGGGRGAGASALGPYNHCRVGAPPREPQWGTDSSRALTRLKPDPTETLSLFDLPMSASVSPLRALAGSPRFPELEQEILRFWDDHEIYHESLRRRSDAPSFVFYEGPPTANGLPHPGHCLTRSIKDVFPRYKTMRGFRCERKAGWDTHGLPVEVEVGKELGIHSKEEIEAFGEEAFIQKCQQSVWRYMQQWQELTRRLGFWVDLEKAYVTYQQSYVESVWWSLKNLFDRGLLYQGHKIVWWWAQGGTALSAGEVGQGYREVADPSVYVLFPLIDHPGRSLVVWTTTPWTLPSNMYAAVHPTDVDYCIVRDLETDQELVMAKALVESIATKLKRKLEFVDDIPASSLIGLRYAPPMNHFRRCHW